MTTPYAQQTVKQLQALGKERKLKGWHTMTKGQLIEALIESDIPGVVTAGAAAMTAAMAALALNPAGPTPEPDPLDVPPALRVDAAEQARRNEARKNEPIGQPAGFSVSTKPATPAQTAAAQQADKAFGKRDTNRGRTITLLKPENPKRPGTKAHDRYALYKDGMTVGAFLDAGGTSGDLAHDQAHGFIKLSNGKH